MFYSLNILKKKNSQFYLIWKIAHNAKVTDREVATMDVEQYCQELCNYVPSGNVRDVANEVSNKMSLYLLSMLFYGIVATHNQKAGILLKKLEHVLVTLKPKIFVERRLHQVDLPQKEKRPQKRPLNADTEVVRDADIEMTDEEYAKRSRMFTLPEDIIERPFDIEQLMAEQGMDVLDVNNEEMNRVLNDELMPEVQNQNEYSLLQDQMIPEVQNQNYEDLMRMDEEFRDFDLRPPSPIEYETRSIDGNIGMETANQLSLFELDAGLLHQQDSRDATLSDVFSLSGLDPIILPRIEPTPRRRAIRAPSAAPSTSRRPRRRNRRLVIDEETEIPDEDLAQGITDYSDIIEELARAPEPKKPVSELLDMFTMIPKHMEERYEPFVDYVKEGNIAGILDVSMSDTSSMSSEYRRASELRSRVSGIPTMEDPIPKPDLSIQLDPLNDRTLMPPPDSFLENIPQPYQLPEEPMLNYPPEGPLNSTEVPFQDLSILQHDDSVQQRRRSSRASSMIPGRPSNIPEPDLIPEEEEQQVGLKEYLEDQRRQLSLENDVVAQGNLLERVLEKIEEDVIAHLDDVYSDPDSPKAKAKDFYNLLCLLKEGKLKERQDEPYGRIRLFI
ncbi:unnamed protein product [Bursaphelenchus okinawaensis]|uniref:Rad21/Rec8-like protein N-terminal domain-containing protein n=1 Tax=Bursaphelenchus okinawaensis TaxID=465554 RepID=A0A811K3H0_9BILA|nr:unnamed protein product [Bursaphelenchus okinawaensis]CAG9091438.1 unnamed protein product [Bursaphelenchus okinawaensis]